VLREKLARSGANGEGGCPVTLKKIKKPDHALYLIDYKYIKFIFYTKLTTK